MNSTPSQFLLQFGIHLRCLRTQAGLSQESLAETADLDRTYISLLERGLRNPTLECLDRLAKSLEVPINELCRFQNSYE